jgi:translation elongation factor EF-G
MITYDSKDIRNVAVLGHGGSGKTILTEAMALKTKAIDRMGKVEDRSTISDYDPEEQVRAISINTALFRSSMVMRKSMCSIPRLFRLCRRTAMRAQSRRRGHYRA